MSEFLQYLHSLAIADADMPQFTYIHVVYNKSDVAKGFMCK